MECCDDEHNGSEGRWYSHYVLRNILIASVLAGTAFLLTHQGLLSPLSEILLFLLAIVIGGYHWCAEAIELLLKKKQVSIDLLMMTATIGSAILGLWDEAAFLVILYGAAEGLEEYTYSKTRSSIRKLLDLAPKEARVKRHNQETMIPAQKLGIGDIIVVKPGEAIATDGVITKGRSSIDESPVTGESIPVEKTEGMKVFAATINHDGVLELMATATFENNTLSKMVHLVEEARERKGKTQLFIETFGKLYSPAVLVAAFLFLVVPPIFGGSFTEWGARAVVLLVAAAPCALIMSTPITVAAGIGNAGKHGVLIKGGMYLENLGKIRTVAFDKTGTITEGQPRITDIISIRADSRRILQWAWSLEHFSTHPLAHAIAQKALTENIVPLSVTDFRSLTGLGLQGKIRDKTYYIGNIKLFEKKGFRPNAVSAIHRLRADGKTVIILGTDDGIEGVIAVQDQTRPESKKVIEELHDMGLKTVMLTGDNNATAQAIAKQVGIDDVRADLSPEDKIRSIDILTKEIGPVAMIGDRINDAPALAQAAVGIAMGAAGTDAAIEASDAALMGDDLEKLLYAVRLGRRARAISTQNIVFSLLILVILIPSALLGFMTVTIAVVVHEISELLAIANGLRVSLPAQD